MKDKYPDYKVSGVQFIKGDMIDTDKKILNDFIEYCGITAGLAKQKAVERKMLQFYDITETSYSEWNLDIFRKFLNVLNQSHHLPATKNDTKKVLKKFLKWKYRDWVIRFDEFRDLKTERDVNYKKLNASTILTKEEVEILIANIDSLKYKALVLLTYESAGRPEEILKLKWADIDFEKKEVTLFSSKTNRSRVNLINESITQLVRYKTECFVKPPRPNDFIFFNPRNKNKHLTTATFSSLFKKLENKISFNKHVFPYLLRHSRLTEVHKVLSPKAYEMFAGHSLEVANERYAHLSNDDVNQEMEEKVYSAKNIVKNYDHEIQQLHNDVYRLKEELQSVIERSNYIFNLKGLLQ